MIIYFNQLNYSSAHLNDFTCCYISLPITFFIASGMLKVYPEVSVKKNKDITIADKLIQKAEDQMEKHD